MRNNISGTQLKEAAKQQKNQTKRDLRKMRLHRVACAARAVFIISLFVLVAIGITSGARAFTLIEISNENGIPASWQVSSVGNPETIAIDMTYFDQKMDPCSATVRQFEWCGCSNQCFGTLQQGIVSNRLGTDGLPVPAYATQTAAKAADINKASQWVTGGNPVSSSDNFYRWYHEVSGISKRYDRTITFNRKGNTNTYVYGGSEIFPLDDITFDDNSVSKDDANVKSRNRFTHNFSFTARMSIPIKAEMTGQEVFSFSGDDDVWVFLNGVLVMDIGGVHSRIAGSFTINADGTVTSSVNGAGTKLIDAGLEKGRVYNLDFFYAERSTSESNTEITITNMNWPISADAAVSGEILENSLVSYQTSLTNIDPDNPLYLTHLAAYVNENDNVKGYIPLNADTLSYTYTPEDANSWTPIQVTAPGSTLNSFLLSRKLYLGASGTANDTIYFKFNMRPEDQGGAVISKIAYLTENSYGDVGISYDSDTVKYEQLVPITPVEPEPTPTPEPEPTPTPEPEPTPTPTPAPTPEPTPTPTPSPDPTPAKKETTTNPVSEPQKVDIGHLIDMGDATISDSAEFAYLDPLGVVAYVPDTGTVSKAASALFNKNTFASIILSQWFILADLAVCAVSFAIFFSLKKYVKNPAQQK